jgi:hypothetical protein
LIPRTLLATGIGLALVALALAALGGAIRGPANPECAGLAAFGCGGRIIGGALVQVLALPVGIASGTFVALWLGRRAQAAEEAQNVEGGNPPSRPHEPPP